METDNNGQVGSYPDRDGEIIGKWPNGIGENSQNAAESITYSLQIPFSAPGKGKSTSIHRPTAAKLAIGNSAIVQFRTDIETGWEMCKRKVREIPASRPNAKQQKII